MLASAHGAECQLDADPFVFVRVISAVSHSIGGARFDLLCERTPESIKEIWKSPAKKMKFIALCIYFGFENVIISYFFFGFVLNGASQASGHDADDGEGFARCLFANAGIKLCFSFALMFAVVDRVFFFKW